MSKEKNNKEPLDLELIVGTLEDAHELLIVVYHQCQPNGWDGPAQVTLYKAIRKMYRLHDMLGEAASEIERLQKAVASGGAS